MRISCVGPRRLSMRRHRVAARRARHAELEEDLEQRPPVVPYHPVLKRQDAARCQPVRKLRRRLSAQDTKRDPSAHSRDQVYALPAFLAQRGHQHDVHRKALFVIPRITHAQKKRARRVLAQTQGVRHNSYRRRMADRRDPSRAPSRCNAGPARLLPAGRTVVRSPGPKRRCVVRRPRRRHH